VVQVVGWGVVQDQLGVQEKDQDYCAYVSLIVSVHGIFGNYS